MEFNSIYKNGKPDYFFITIDREKGERAHNPTTITGATRCNTNFAPTVNRKFYYPTKKRVKLWAQ